MRRCCHTPHAVTKSNAPTRFPSSSRSAGDAAYEDGSVETNLVSAVFPVDPAALAIALADIPCRIYARSLLMSGTCQVRLAADRDAALILDVTSAALVRRPDPRLLREALAGDPPGPALLVQDDAVLAAQTVLPDWISRPFIVHTLPQPYSANAPPEEGVIDSARLTDPECLACRHTPQVSWVVALPGRPISPGGLRGGRVVFWDANCPQPGASRWRRRADCAGPSWGGRPRLRGE